MLNPLHSFLGLVHTRFRSSYLKGTLETSFSSFPSVPILQMRKQRSRKEKGSIEGCAVS